MPGIPHPCAFCRDEPVEAPKPMITGGHGRNATYRTRCPLPVQLQELKDRVEALELLIREKLDSHG